MSIFIAFFGYGYDFTLIHTRQVTAQKLELCCIVGECCKAVRTASEGGSTSLPLFYMWGRSCCIHIFVIHAKKLDNQLILMNADNSPFSYHAKRLDNQLILVNADNLPFSNHAKRLDNQLILMNADNLPFSNHAKRLDNQLTLMNADNLPFSNT